MQFCRNHPLLEAFRLRAFEDDGFPPSKPSAKTWNAESWGNLSRLRILSIEPILLVAGNLFRNNMNGCKNKIIINTMFFFFTQRIQRKNSQRGSFRVPHCLRYC